MSIRLQLLVIAFTTLVLPWAGCQYARELESTLRVAQENALRASADTVAHALSAEPQRVFADADDGAFDPALGDRYAFALHQIPLLDGYREDWGIAAEPGALGSAAGIGARLQAGLTDRHLYLYLEVEDPRFDPEPNDVHPDRDRFDRVDVLMSWPDQSTETFFFATSAPGPIEAQREVTGDDGTARAVNEPRIQGFWLQTSRGYHLEARVPLSMVGTRLWIEARDGASGATAGFMSADTQRGGRLFRKTPGLDALLGTFIRAGTRATVVDSNALKLGLSGSIDSSKPGVERPDAGTWYRRFIAGDTTHWPELIVAADHVQGAAVAEALRGRSAAGWVRGGQGQEAVLSAAAPLLIEGRVRGAVLLEQAGDQFVDLRDRALARLFNLTLLASALAVLVAFGVAGFISLRIGRLRIAADTAVGPEGRIRLAMPEADRGDEIGALARAFERLLSKLNEHGQYLRTLGGKLSHELRTPLTIVRSSLDNLESEGVSMDQRIYVTRAQEGVQRLQSILSALGAASRVEESIVQSDRANFDLQALVSSAALGYQAAFPRAGIRVEVPDGACPLRGAPELIVQLLDKLVENAVDFCPPAGEIVIRLRRVQGDYELAVTNDGPPIPEHMLGRLFESLFEHRQGQDDRPHFGLGLYIVRLIVEFHGGRAAAANGPGGRGVVFTAYLPMI